MEDKIIDVLFIIGIFSVFILKLAGVITCSWLVLLSPIIILLALGIILAIGLSIMYLIYIYIIKKEK